MDTHGKFFLLWRKLDRGQVVKERKQKLKLVLDSWLETRREEGDVW